MNKFCPSDTRSIVPSSSRIENFALRYQYFLDEDSRSRYKLKLHPSKNKLDKSSMELVKQLRTRQTTQLQNFAQQGMKFYCVDATVDWRLIVGLGSEHVQETNMTLHHIYGIPYIPGSAVKGVLRHWWLEEDFVDSTGKVNEEKALDDPDFLSVFGSQKQRGKVQFLDAYPEEVLLATDIMNPHYTEYYSKQKPPTDHQRLVPINFLTVEKTTFRFVFLAKEQKHLDHLDKRFQKALDIKGVGAKTAVGYGYFRDFVDQTVSIVGTTKSKQQTGQPKIGP